MVLETAFAPAERDTSEQVLAQHQRLAALPFVQEFLNAMPHMTVVLNGRRQIVFANRIFARLLGFRTENSLLGAAESGAVESFVARVLGMRPGEAVGCIRSHLTEGGCGTTVYCRSCGFVRSILNSQALGGEDVQDGVLVRRDSSDGAAESIDLRVWARPIDVEGESFTIFSLVDISADTRRDALERIFFHDVLNTASGLRGLAELLANEEAYAPNLRETAEMLVESTDHLVDEINAQRMLSAAESGELQVKSELVRARVQLEQMQHHFASGPPAAGKTLRIDGAMRDFVFTSDPTLIRRVLTNLVKNALEASAPGDEVVLSCGSDAEAHAVWFSVRNAGVMPEEVQRRVFTRSFSTKGRGRGLGTYSIQLLSERYLQGRASFASSAPAGTTFTVRYPRFLS
ncbi:MAG: ATP-binding protein [Gemmatimonadota bacterium]|nr:ATP-binding protein [Gemmatimonadota bacterium]